MRELCLRRRLTFTLSRKRVGQQSSKHSADARTLLRRRQTFRLCRSQSNPQGSTSHSTSQPPRGGDWRKRVGVEPTKNRLATLARFEAWPPHRGALLFQ